jgi:signal transduction histidine kinase
VNAERENDEIHIMVKDEGIGIKPDEIDKIFEEFYRTRRALEIEKDGTGLGLPIVQKAVDALGGRITVYSEEGKGTTFHVYFRDSLLVKK